jgi:catechol 2,3-dioxygenase-like lactoylglutathione lyase family enzyme
MKSAKFIEQQITFLNTAILSETAEFYEEKLGLELALDQGSCRIYRVCAGAYLGFCSREGGARPDGIILTLVSADVEGWHLQLESRGVVFEKAPTYNAAYDITQAFLRDPNGYLIEIQRFEDPRWNPR